MSNIEISFVCPITKHAGDVAAVHREFRDVIARTGRRAEFIYVLDGLCTGAEESIAAIDEDHFPVRVFRMAKGFGESTALQFGFEQARGSFILTIADRYQIDARLVNDVLARLDAGDEVIVTRREPRSDAFLNRLQSKVFHGLVRRLTGQSFLDLTCGLRGFTREAALRLDLYGDQHRFIPVIAVRCGYRVIELPGAQHAENTALRLRGPGVYARRLLDILNIYFLTRFTRKPLRFFGLVGLTLGGVGFGICALLAAQRLMTDSPLAGRPLLLLGVLLIVLGVQVTSIGLLGEIIIFLSTRRETPEASEFSELKQAEYAGTPVDAPR